MIVSQELKMVDVHLALTLMGGHEQIYQKVIESFLDTQSNLIEQLEYYLKTDLETAERLVHSCKGISKNIGSEPLFHVSEAFDNALKERNNIDPHFIKFKEVFEQVLIDLKQIKFE